MEADKFCSNCGKLLKKPGARFCTACGEPVGEASPPVDSPAPKRGDRLAVTAVTGKRAGEASLGGPPARRMLFPKWGLALAVVIVVAAAGVGAYFLTRPGDDLMVSTTETVVSTTPPTPAGPSSTAPAATEPSVLATEATEPQRGRDLKVGIVTPVTGYLSIFGVSDQYCVDRWQEAVGDGVVGADGMHHGITFIIRDSQSEANRAAQLAGDLILNDQVDVMVVGGPADNVMPVADQCEAAGVPCISTGIPWDTYFFDRGGSEASPFRWTYHFSWGLDDLAQAQIALWSNLTSGGRVGVLWPDNAEGRSFARTLVPHYSATYEVIDPGSYDLDTEDFTGLISVFQRANCSIVTGCPYPMHLANFWKQALQRGYSPAVATFVGGVLHPQLLEAVGQVSVGLTTELSWSPAFPFASSLTGETCRQLADDFESRMGGQWVQGLRNYALGEIAIHVLATAADLDDKESIREALSMAKLGTIAGPVDFSSPVVSGTLHPVANVYKSPLAMGQAVRGTKWAFDLVVVENSMAPMVPIQREPEPIR